MLAEEDFEKSKSLENILTMNYELCRNIETQINLIRFFEDKFFRIKDFKNNEIILYASNHNAFLPQCRTINEIEIITPHKNCFEDIPIRFKSKNNKTINAYLAEDRFIRLISKTKECEYSFKFYPLKINNSSYIKKHGNEIKLEKRKYNEKINLGLYKPHKLNYFHAEIITEGFDAISEFEKITKVTEINGDYLVIPSKLTEIEAENAKSIVEAAQYTNTLIKRISATISVCIFSAALITLACCISKIKTMYTKKCDCCIRNNNNKRNSQTKEEAINLNIMTQPKTSSSEIEETSMNTLNLIKQIEENQKL